MSAVRERLQNYEKLNAIELPGFAIEQPYGSFRVAKTYKDVQLKLFKNWIFVPAEPKKIKRNSNSPKLGSSESIMPVLVYLY